MFIRETLTRRRADKCYRSVRLVENFRTGRKVQQKTPLNLGAAFPIPKSQWPELVELVQAGITGETPLFDPEPELATMADTIVQKLRSRALVQSAAEALDGGTANIRLDSIQIEDARSVGCERLALAALEALGFLGVLKNVGLSDRDARIAMALVIARMVHPASERETLRWLETNSATFELLRLNTGPALYLDKLYRLSDGLVKHHEAIEDALFDRQRTLFGSSGAVIFYDLTNTYMTGRPASDLARFGRSKQKRNDCPLVTLAMATDEGGFPRRSSVLPGNVSEPGTLFEALDSLATPEDKDKPTVIMDAGIATENNLAELRNRGYHWITVRRGGVKPDQADAAGARDPDATIETRSGHEARIWNLSHEPENEAQLCIWSQARQERDEAILAKKRDAFEAELTALHDGLSKPRSVKTYDKVLERLGRLRERYAMVNQHYDIRVTKGSDGKASAVTWVPNAAFNTRDARAGLYVLRTSHTEWGLEKTVRTYWRLTELEATFETLKSELGLRPIWHQLSRRIEGHLFIAVLALYGVNVIRTRLAAQGVHDSWASVRNKLGRWQRATTSFTSVDGARIEVRTDARPDPVAAGVAKAAGVPYALERRIRKLKNP